MKAGECLHKQAYRIGGRTAKCPECKCIILPNGDAVPDEKPSMAHKFLWDALDTPSRETIIDKLNCWDYILEAMEEYAQSRQPEKVSDEEIVTSIPYPNPISKHQSDINIGWVRCRKAMRDNPEQFKK